MSRSLLKHLLTIGIGATLSLGAAASVSAQSVNMQSNGFGTGDKTDPSPQGTAPSILKPASSSPAAAPTTSASTPVDNFDVVVVQGRSFKAPAKRRSMASLGVGGASNTGGAPLQG